jgi:hypothetical protein
MPCKVMANRVEYGEIHKRTADGDGIDLEMCLDSGIISDSTIGIKDVSFIFCKSEGSKMRTSA